MLFIPSLISLLLLFTLSISAEEYGEHCELGVNSCNASKFLQCSALTQTCECQRPLSTWYDQKEDVCKLLVGSDCTRVGVGIQECVTNSICPSDSSNPRCTCNLGFEENRNNLCFIPYGGTCTETDIIVGEDRCDPAGFLECSNLDYTCQCQKSHESIYNEGNKTCSLLRNSFCTPLQDAMPCSKNSVCDLQDQMCRCEDGFSGTRENRCALPFGATCDPFNDQCNTLGYSTCHPDIKNCLCRPEWEALYDTLSMSCRLLEGAGCSHVEGSQACVNDSECLPAQGSEPRRCQCHNNLKPNKNRECFLTHGDTCDYPFRDLCDPAGYLYCSSGYRCECENPFATFDPVKKECRLELRAKCKIGNGEMVCGDNAGCDENGVCSCLALYEEDENGECFRRFGAPCSEQETCNTHNMLYCLNGMCSCTSGFQESSIHGGKYSVTCLPSYQQSCPFGPDLLPCNHEAQLNCFGGSCLCSAPGHQVYLTDERRCATLAGNECIPLPQNITSHVCVPFAECKQTQGYLQGKCTCDFGYRQTITGQCTDGSNSISSSTFSLFILLLFLHFTKK